MSTDANAARTRAEANFRKEERAKDGAKAMLEYQAQGRAIREKTARLKALRLAKETADKAGEKSAKPARSKSSSPAKARNVNSATE